MVSARKAKHLDATTMFTYSHANTPHSQSERAYYLSYFIKPNSLYRAACLQTTNGFFCSVNHLSGGGVNANHKATHSPSLARKNKIENDPKLLKNSQGNRDDE